MNTRLSFDSMSVPQRLELIAQIWDSIPDSDAALDIPEWHREELEKRLAAVDANPQAGIPWDKALARLRKKA